MLNPGGLVSISLGSVVMDLPDDTGRFIAKDLAGGWAYIVTDADGDNRCRGQGVCDGGLDLTLRCAFLAAADRIADCKQIRIFVETRQAHQIMVRIALKDSRVAAAIRGRPVSVMTRPDARASFLVRIAAERAAVNALRDREYAEWHAPESGGARNGAENGFATVTAAPDTGEADALNDPRNGTSDWRARLSLDVARPSIGLGDADPRAVKGRPSMNEALPSAGRFMAPLIRRAREGLAAAGMMAPRQMSRGGNVQAWLLELDGHVATVSGDLQEVGM